MINWWRLAVHLNRLRVIPRLFLSVYMYLLITVSNWFMSLQAPTMEQAGFVSVIVGAGAAWFGLYANTGGSVNVNDKDDK